MTLTERTCPFAECGRVHDCAGPCGVECGNHFCDLVEV